MGDEGGQGFGFGFVRLCLCGWVRSQVRHHPRQVVVELDSCVPGEQGWVGVGSGLGWG